MSISLVKQKLSDALLNLDAYATLRLGRESDINIYSERDKPLYWWVFPYTESLGNIGNENRYVEQHQISIYIVNQDKESADNLESFNIVSACEILGQKLLLHIYEVFTDEYQAEITGANIGQVIKFKAQNIYTGVVLRFTISLPNTETIC